MSLWCAVCDKDAHLVCSGCKVTRYCSKECQLFDWKKRNHKMGCKMQQICNEANAAHAARPCPRPPTDHCTGCNRRFRDEDDGPCDECPDCGYLACESCASHHSRGTCYCEGGNFGQLYCQVAPRTYHFSGHTGCAYRGDRHPPLEEWSNEYTEDDYEPVPRKCGNCGEVARMLKPESKTPAY